jgi:hypothetical protein
MKERLDDRDSMRILRELDETTDWKLPRELQDDGEGDDASVATLPPTAMDAEDNEQLNILDCVKGMVENGTVQDIVLIVNTNENDMIVFTDLEANDVIMGRFSCASHNWWNTQKEMREFLENEDFDEGGEE